jgi:hypothetical protein
MSALTDRELLELAAKAAGLLHVSWGLKRVTNSVDMWGVRDGPKRECLITAGLFWDPLHDDGDALRLAAKLLHCIDYVIVEWPDEEVGVMRRGVDMPATRRAIVLAAAELGRTTS